MIVPNSTLRAPRPQAVTAPAHTLRAALRRAQLAAGARRRACGASKARTRAALAAEQFLLALHAAARRTVFQARRALARRSDTRARSAEPLSHTPPARPLSCGQQRCLGQHVPGYSASRGAGAHAARRFRRASSSAGSSSSRHLRGVGRTRRWFSTTFSDAQVAAHMHCSDALQGEMPRGVSRARVPPQSGCGAVVTTLELGSVHEAPTQLKHMGRTVS